MADDRKIIHGVHVGDKLITDPDELAAVLTPEMQQRLEKSGSITGNWKPKAETSAKSDKPAKSDKKE